MPPMFEEYEKILLGRINACSAAVLDLVKIFVWAALFFVLADVASYL